MAFVPKLSLQALQCFRSALLFDQLLGLVCLVQPESPPGLAEFDQGKDGPHTRAAGGKMSVSNPLVGHGPDPQ
ncbi:MAG: hypothetical protein CMJ81_08025 [Planctomycetaceae bacterium]|nr:hypothetical protein [Planctomycetaceae bacterium]MBP63929.1 hypothetical protein [Planctomycetaceae bacterium]